MNGKKSWFDYMNPGSQRGNFYQQFSWLMDDICKLIKKLFNNSGKGAKKPAKKTVGRQAHNKIDTQQDTVGGKQGRLSGSGSESRRIQGGSSGTSQDNGDSLPADLNVVRRGKGHFSRAAFSEDAAMPGMACQINSGGKAEPDRRESLRNAVLWSEILGEPAAKKRHRKRMSQYYGNQGNADRR